jgi:hypothetical protein
VRNLDPTIIVIIIILTSAYSVGRSDNITDCGWCPMLSAAAPSARTFGMLRARGCEVFS